MINDDTLIKIVRSRGYKKTWPDQVNRMKARLTWIKLGFPGIRNDHLTISLAKDLKEGDLYIYDQYLEKGFGYGDEAPLMLRVLGSGKCIVEGIGQGADSKRDPYRVNLRWKDVIEMPGIGENELILRVNPSPTLNGGSAYYYFFKSYRDFRD